MSGSPGFFTEGDFGNAAAAERGTDLIPSTAGEVLGATFGQGISENPSSRLGRLVARNIDAAPRALDPDEANATFGIEGRLSFTEPTTERVARDLYEHHHAQAVREDTLRRSGGGFGTGGLARFGAGAAASLLDPLNIAAAFVPFVGEARVAALLGNAARGAFGRLAVRGIEGAGQGLVGTAALEPVQYWLSQKDHDDWTMGAALTRLAFGTALGGVLHGGIGAFIDRRGPLPDWTPEMHEAALRHSTAAVVEGRPVNAAAAMDMVAARTARGELGQWFRSAQQAADEADAALAKATSIGETRAALARSTDALRTEAETLRTEATQARVRNPAEAPDPALDTQRGQVQAGALEGVAAKQDGAAAEAGAKLEGTDAAERQAYSLADTKAKTAEARAELVQGLARMIQLADGEATTLASRLLKADPKQIDATLDEIISDLSNRPRSTVAELVVQGRGLEAAEAKVQSAGDRLASLQSRAETTLRGELRGMSSTEIDEIGRAIAARTEQAPKVEGGFVDQLTELEKLNKEIGDVLKAEDKAFAEREVAAGRKAPEPDADLVAADEAAKEGEAMAKAYEAAAICAIGRA